MATTTPPIRITVWHKHYHETHHPKGSQVFCFRPGYKTYPIYFAPNIRRGLAQGVQYVASRSKRSPNSLEAPNTQPLFAIGRS